MPSPRSTAWVESPLQLLCAIEWSHATGRAVDIVPRLGALQLEATIARVLPLGLPRGVAVRAARASGAAALVGGPAHWLVGDAFSGQAALALSARRPARLTVLDDGAATRALVPVLAGSAPLSRPGAAPSAPARTLAALAAARLRALAASGALELFSCYPLAHPARTANGFAWLRSRRWPLRPPATVTLGSAAVVDGLVDEGWYLDWVARQQRPSTYYPHRREGGALTARVAALPGVTVSRAGLPIELLLAGSTSVRVASLPSSALDTLAIILADADYRLAREPLPRPVLAAAS
jgi:hypothetical protein